MTFHRIRMALENWIGDKQHYTRCVHCGNTFRGKWEGSYIRYTFWGTFSWCSKCGIPKGEGRLYKIRSGDIIPANSEAFQFEMERAGQKGALYSVEIVE